MSVINDNPNPTIPTNGMKPQPKSGGHDSGPDTKQPGTNHLQTIPAKVARSLRPIAIDESNPIPKANKIIPVPVSEIADLELSGEAVYVKDFNGNYSNKEGEAEFQTAKLKELNKTHERTLDESGTKIQSQLIQGPKCAQRDMIMARKALEDAAAGNLVIMVCETGMGKNATAEYLYNLADDKQELTRTTYVYKGAGDLDKLPEGTKIILVDKEQITKNEGIDFVGHAEQIKNKLNPEGTKNVTITWEGAEDLSKTRDTEAQVLKSLITENQGKTNTVNLYGSSDRLVAVDNLQANDYDLKTFFKLDQAKDRVALPDVITLTNAGLHPKLDIYDPLFTGIDSVARLLKVDQVTPGLVAKNEQLLDFTALRILDLMLMRDENTNEITGVRNTMVFAEQLTRTKEKLPIPSQAILLQDMLNDIPSLKTKFDKLPEDLKKQLNITAADLQALVEKTDSHPTSALTIKGDNYRKTAALGVELGAEGKHNALLSVRALNGTTNNPKVELLVVLQHREKTNGTGEEARTIADANFYAQLLGLSSATNFKIAAFQSGYLDEALKASNQRHTQKSPHDTLVFEHNTRKYLTATQDEARSNSRQTKTNEDTGSIAITESRADASLINPNPAILQSYWTDVVGLSEEKLEQKVKEFIHSHNGQAAGREEHICDCIYGRSNIHNQDIIVAFGRSLMRQGIAVNLNALADDEAYASLGIHFENTERLRNAIDRANSSQENYEQFTKTVVDRTASHPHEKLARSELYLISSTLAAQISTKLKRPTGASRKNETKIILDLKHPNADYTRGAVIRLNIKPGFNIDRNQPGILVRDACNTPDQAAEKVTRVVDLRHIEGKEFQCKIGNDYHGSLIDAIPLLKPATYLAQSLTNIISALANQTKSSPGQMSKKLFGNKGLTPSLTKYLYSIHELYSKGNQAATEDLLLETYRMLGFDNLTREDLKKAPRLEEGQVVLSNITDFLPQAVIEAMRTENYSPKSDQTTLINGVTELVIKNFHEEVTDSHLTIVVSAEDYSEITNKPQMIVTLEPITQETTEAPPPAKVENAAADISAITKAIKKINAFAVKDSTHPITSPNPGLELISELFLVIQALAQHMELNKESIDDGLYTGFEEKSEEKSEEKKRSLEHLDRFLGIVKEFGLSDSQNIRRTQALLKVFYEHFGLQSDEKQFQFNPKGSGQVEIMIFPGDIGVDKQRAPFLDIEKTEAFAKAIKIEQDKNPIYALFKAIKAVDDSYTSTKTGLGLTIVNNLSVMYANEGFIAELRQDAEKIVENSKNKKGQEINSIDEIIVGSGPGKETPTTYKEHEALQRYQGDQAAKYVREYVNTLGADKTKIAHLIYAFFKYHGVEVKIEDIKQGDDIIVEPVTLLKDVDFKKLGTTDNPFYPKVKEIRETFNLLVGDSVH